MMQTYIVAFSIALAVAYFITPRVMDLAIKVGALDAPDERKVHKGMIPRMGGLAIYVAFVLAVLASTTQSVSLLVQRTF